MWSFKRTVHAIAWSVVLAAPVALAGCTGLTPIYGANGLGSERVEIRYGAPNSRTEQIIYQDLALRLGKADGDVPLVTIATSQRATSLTNDTVNAPSSQRQMIVTASISVTSADGRSLFSGSRSATADFTTAAQPLASQQATDDAAARAAHLLADTIRLEILAALMK